jgi:periplasmic protein TonB
MIPVSRLAAASALLIALGVHGGAMIMQTAPEDIQIEGGAPAAVTAFGNAFSDMVAGTTSPAEAELNEAKPPIDTAQKPDTATQAQKQPPQPEPKQKTPPVSQPETAQAPSPVEPIAAAPSPVRTATNAPSVASVQPTLAQHATAAIQLPATPKTEPTQAQTPPIQPTASVDQPKTTPQQTAASQPTTALTYNEPVAVATLQPVTRPITQSAQVPDKPVDPVVAATKPVKPATPIKPVVKPQPKPKSPPRAQGNSDQNAKRGTASGTKPKASAKSGTNNARSSKQGNAAKSTYKGKVYRKINRKKLRAKIKGTVRVSFGISASGALTRLSVSRSSGSGKLDQLALQQVRRAAPFPAPPDGALSLSIEIRSK